MNGSCVPSRGSMVGLLCASVVLVGCSDDSTGPVVDPAFDPAFAVEVVDAVMADFKSTEVGAVMGHIAFALSQAQPTPAAAGATTLPGTGSTYVYDDVDLEWTIDPDRAGAPENGVRVIWYVMHPTANSPALPLEERGWVDLVHEQISDTEASMEVTFFLLDGEETTESADYGITFQEDPGSGSFTVMAEGRAGTVDFDVERSFTYGEQEGLYELLVSFGGDAGLLAASVEAPFDPTTGEETTNPLFMGSLLTNAHYLLVETDWDSDTGDLDGTVEADDEIVLNLVGTTSAPTFRLPGGDAPAVDVQNEMAEIWAGLWGLVGHGVGLIHVMESLYR